MGILSVSILGFASVISVAIDFARSGTNNYNGNLSNNSIDILESIVLKKSKNVFVNPSI